MPARWQPIETAPKDGEHVLVLTLLRDCAVAWWCPHRSAWFVAFNEGPELTATVTHWMPLPEPPDAQQPAPAPAAPTGGDEGMLRQMLRSALGGYSTDAGVAAQVAKLVGDVEALQHQRDTARTALAEAERDLREVVRNHAEELAASIAAAKGWPPMGSTDNTPLDEHIAKKVAQLEAAERERDRLAKEMESWKRASYDRSEATRAAVERAGFGATSNPPARVIDALREDRDYARGDRDRLREALGDVLRADKAVADADTMEACDAADAEHKAAIARAAALLPSEQGQAANEQETDR